MEIEHSIKDYFSYASLKCIAGSSWLRECVLIVDQIHAMITTKKAMVIGILQ
jgi:hypothetical protein